VRQILAAREAAAGRIVQKRRLNDQRVTGRSGIQLLVFLGEHVIVAEDVTRLPVFDERAECPCVAVEQAPDAQELLAASGSSELDRVGLWRLRKIRRNMVCGSRPEGAESKSDRSGSQQHFAGNGATDGNRISTADFRGHPNPPFSLTTPDAAVVCAEHTRSSLNSPSHGAGKPHCRGLRVRYEMHAAATCGSRPASSPECTLSGSRGDGLHLRASWSRLSPAVQ
jgi:hypothetical protein